MHYHEILYRVVIATPDDRIIIERVTDDLAAASIYFTRQRVSDILAKAEADQ